MESRTSTRIFLNSQGYSLVSSFGFGEPSQKRDVFDFGLLLLELATRKSPVESLHLLKRLRSLEPHEWKLRGSRIYMHVDELDIYATCKNVYSCGSKGVLYSSGTGGGKDVGSAEYAGGCEEVLKFSDRREAYHVSTGGRARGYRRFEYGDEERPKFAIL